MKEPDYAPIAEAPHPSLSPKGRGRSVAPVLLPLPLGEGGGEGSRHSLRYVPKQVKEQYPMVASPMRSTIHCLPAWRLRA